MKSSLQFDAIIFDMDGLMFDTERIGLEAFCHAASMHGYKNKEEFFKNLIGRTVADADRAMKETFGSDFPITAVRQDRALYISEIRRTSGIPMKTGLRELLKYLKKRGIPLGIASSSAHTIVKENLIHAGIQQYFQTYLCGDEIINGKPHPEIYLKMAKRLSKNPSTCIVLEDSLLGVTAAYTAGMIPIMVPDMQEPTESIRQIAHRIFPSLHEVRTYLEAMNASEK